MSLPTITLPILTINTKQILRTCCRCSQPAVLACSLCSSSYLPDHREYYCSEQCQSACKQGHEARCNMGVLWLHVQVTAHTRDTGIEQVILDTARDLELSESTASSMVQFLKAVSYRHRSRTLGPKDYRLREDALQSIKSITARSSSKEGYIAAQEASETDKERDTIRAGNEYQLRPDRRPWVSIDARGCRYEGVPLYTFDFGMLSFFDWMDGWGDPLMPCAINPWSMKIGPFEMNNE